MISIQRHAETKELVVMITSGKNTSYINASTANNDAHLHQMIGSTAQAMGQSWEYAVDNYDFLYRKLFDLSRERKRRLQQIEIPDNLINDYRQFSAIRNIILSGGILTLEEIYWWDYMIRKYKLGCI